MEPESHVQGSLRPASGQLVRTAIPYPIPEGVLVQHPVPVDTSWKPGQMPARPKWRGDLYRLTPEPGQGPTYAIETTEESFVRIDCGGCKQAATTLFAGQMPQRQVVAVGQLRWRCDRCYRERSS